MNLNMRTPNIYITYLLNILCNFPLLRPNQTFHFYQFQSLVWRHGRQTNPHQSVHCRGNCNFSQLPKINKCNWSMIYHDMKEICILFRNQLKSFIQTQTMTRSRAYERGFQPEHQTGSRGAKEGPVNLLRVR